MTSDDTTKKQEQLAKALTWAHAWEVQTTALGVLLIPQERSRQLDSPKAESYTLDDMALFNVRLRQLFHTWSQLGRVRVTRGEIETALRSLQESSLHLPREAILVNHRPSPVRGLRGALSMEVTARGLLLHSASWFEMAPMLNGEYYGHQEIIDNVLLCRKWLDVHFTGWEQRVNLGLSVDLASMELCSLVFNLSDSAATGVAELAVVDCLDQVPLVI